MITSPRLVSANLGRDLHFNVFYIVLSVQVVENVKENLKQHIYNTVIPRNVRLAEAPSYGMPIIEYDPRSAGAEHYMMLADEVIENDYYR